ncbi:MAG: hypothetical protein K9J37_19365, partial [Saprospiraceae bacterium]|nr:hypothetical protein [Saprospiraceae bacterium]MCF8252085.1 hypothetical protein [Saprospiraceae bacterium]MCF8281791.1 hypothetical protein [Bacteroidales bacterium]MCF8313728.1 hypothetical protein [Saprospiraceae bacterium]MCF8442435.1 hypothetical protein [Saprospiraceae bacterium]
KTEWIYPFLPLAKSWSNTALNTQLKLFFHFQRTALFLRFKKVYGREKWKGNGRAKHLLQGLSYKNSLVTIGAPSGRDVGSNFIIKGTPCRIPIATGRDIRRKYTVPTARKAMVRGNSYRHFAPMGP